MEQPLELESDDDLTDSEESVYSGLEDSGSDSTNSSAGEEEDEEEREEPGNGAAPEVRSGDGGRLPGWGALLEHCARRWAPIQGRLGTAGRAQRRGKTDSEQGERIDSREPFGKRSPKAHLCRTN
ncbi:ribosome biogenesis protein BOP1-like [Meleagris gallopavo]|uniref:ribosome biogenesis protein BOP1-like n=1 Tax=Meleagris gallopavo TaxID=9103 RepID=UPI00093E8C4D|nr:ribosome biogenesis protein BOP1-like [Meleagris gallopavo]